MDIQLSAQQQAVVDCTEPRIVVKACPGSGKTFSVAARMAKLLCESNLSRHQGIAAISFTNTACEVIQKELKETFGYANIGYPSFIGTIDSFINMYIFLPYAHLVMGCDCRPEIVGTEFNKWFDYDSAQTRYIRGKHGERIITSCDVNYYFDLISFGLNDQLLRLAPYQAYHFGKADWENPNKKDGSPKKIISELKEMKWKHFNAGKVNQADAIYFTFRILDKYPSIAQNIVRRFPILIIDEAQDATELQMAIIDKLSQHGADSIMLIGDPDQAIFEWNTANPHLFMEKYKSMDWYSLDLSENRRSSEKICQLANRFSGNAMSSIAADKDYAEKPCLKGHLSTSESVNQITDNFIEKCKEIGLNESEYAIVFRGQSFGATYFGLANNDNSDVSRQSSPWKNGYYGVRDIVYGKYLIDQGKYTEGLSLIEKGYYKITKQVRYVSTSTMRMEIAEVGFRSHREKMISFIQRLPSTNKTLLDWITELKQEGIDLTVELGKANISIESLFRASNHQLKQERSYLRTIHSVKGMTLEAILVFLSKKAVQTNYTTILNDSVRYCIHNNEELRIVYVACTRPKKLLWIAVPSDDVECWRNKLFLEHN